MWARRTRRAVSLLVIGIVALSLAVQALARRLAPDGTPSPDQRSAVAASASPSGGAVTPAPAASPPARPGRPDPTPLASATPTLGPPGPTATAPPSATAV
ncbi:MAG TPA: hypothetical protein VGL23_13355, partial [Chloroflexota bacterium]